MRITKLVANIKTMEATVFSKYFHVHLVAPGVYDAGIREANKRGEDQRIPSVIVASCKYFEFKLIASCSGRC